MPDNLTQRHQPDRSKINMNEDYEVKYWTHALGASRDQIQRAIDKVGKLCRSSSERTWRRSTGANVIALNRPMCFGNLSRHAQAAELSTFFRGNSPQSH